MALFVTSLNSGSNGNCYYIGNEREAVLIDAGISCRETERRLSRLGLSMETVKAVFISHEHTDHISGLPRLAKKHRLPVFISPGTLRNSYLPRNEFPIHALHRYEPVCVGNLCVTPFPKRHDAADPHSFLVSENGITIGVFTDIGSACDDVITHFSQCQAAFLEANYDEDMLETGRYPYFLKQRIRGGHGHLSNQQALALFRQHRPAAMTHLWLSHLSKENNSPQVAHDLFQPHLGDTHLAIASRYAETPVFRVGQ